MPSSWKRGNQQLNSEHPVTRGRPPKRCAGTSLNPNQRQNHLVLSNQVSSIDNNPHSAGNLQLFSADQLETLRTMIEDKVSESSRDIAKLLQTFRLGANIGFFGRCSPRFSRNLPTALAQPDIVKANLDKEVSLGRVAGPFSTLPFPNFQVSTMGLVPKRYSDKFRTIFHLSFPKSGVTSINYSISKKDFS